MKTLTVEHKKNISKSIIENRKKRKTQNETPTSQQKDRDSSLETYAA